jgi:hypothetical protein
MIKVHINIGLQILSFQVRALLIFWNLMEKAPSQQSWWPYTHCMAVCEITYYAVVAHTNIIEMYANRALEMYQMVLVTVLI